MKAWGYVSTNSPSRECAQTYRIVVRRVLGLELVGLPLKRNCLR